MNKESRQKNQDQQETIDRHEPEQNWLGKSNEIMQPWITGYLVPYI